MTTKAVGLPTTINYTIIVVNDPEHEGIDCYGVINRNFDVVEYYDNLLPRTYQAMVSMQREYDKMVDDINKPSLASVDTKH